MSDDVAIRELRPDDRDTFVDEVKQLARLHPRSTGVALNTENPDNVTLYTRMGFRLTEVVEHGRLSIHAMRWNADRA